MGSVRKRGDRYFLTSMTSMANGRGIFCPREQRRPRPEINFVPVKKWWQGGVPADQGSPQVH